MLHFAAAQSSRDFQKTIRQSGLSVINMRNDAKIPYVFHAELRYQVYRLEKRLVLRYNNLMQYKIPQNVQIEDKIVGPLTLKQLITLGVGGGITYGIYVTLARNFFIETWLIPTLIPGILTLLVTFVKINGIPFGKWVFLMIEFMWKPKIRTFVMGGGDLYMATLFAEKTKKAQTANDAETKAERDRERLKNIGEITKMLDTVQSKPQVNPL